MTGWQKYRPAAPANVTSDPFVGKAQDVMPESMRIMDASARKRRSPNQAAPLLPAAANVVPSVAIAKSQTESMGSRGLRSCVVASDLQEMIAERQFDFAVVCSPPHMHVEQLRLLLDAGIPTLCEKPLALSATDARTVEKLAETNGVPVRIAHHLRHQTTYRLDPVMARVGCDREPREAFFEWSFAMNHSAPSATWKLDPNLNGLTSLSDAGSHCVDIAIGRFGPGDVRGATGRRHAGGTFEACDVLSMHGGVSMVLRASREYGPFSNQLLISGTEGEIRAEGFFTEKSAAAVELRSADGQTETVERLPGNPYALEVEDFALLASDKSDVSAGTTLPEAVAACALIDSAESILRSLP